VASEPVATLTIRRCFVKTLPTRVGLGQLLAGGCERHMIAEKSGLLWLRRRTRMTQLAPTTAARALLAGEFAAGEGGDVGACVGVSVDAPAALG
jgi:hypothetical protein